ncbi:DUF2238 domain-containing protein [bacterium]|nr:DUF2238 domain-containing protein [candidate division CSSED10-310 bacterium]
MTQAISKKRYHFFLLITFLCVFWWSAIGPYDFYTWLLEVIPTVIGTIILLSIYRKFQFTNLVYTLIWIHMIILVIGGHYTYARVPLGNWVRDWLELTRNNYDRLGHFVQGFIPAMIAREVFLKKSPLKPGGWLFFIVTCFCLGFSAFFELFEWWVALLSGSSADAFLATQGDVWDTQWDMFLALCGSLIAQITLSKFHDKSLSFKISKSPNTDDSR